LSEDFGVVYNGQCECGRKGSFMKIVRRVNGIESRGCALKLAVGTKKDFNNNDRFYDSYYRNPDLYKNY
jgi:long-chain-fatty-acid---luciferin-component ligase